jgi:lysyl-tRNA synthetase class II
MSACTALVPFMLQMSAASTRNLSQFITQSILKESFKTLSNGVEDEAGMQVAVAGRVMAKRVMGKLAFLTLRDDKGQIQVKLCRAVNADVTN